MKLQGRNLSPETQGDDVKLLQSELGQLGFKIPDSELQRAFFGPGTYEAVEAFQKQKGLDTTGVVDERAAALINAEVAARLPFVVKGEVRQASEDIYVGATVRAFNKNLRSEDLLGETKTDAAGRYEIRYGAEQFQRSHESSADLIVQVFNDAGELQVGSPIFFDAPPEQTIDLMVGGGTYRGPSEYEQLVTTLTPLLDGVQPAELTDDDVAFLDSLKRTVTVNGQDYHHLNPDALEDLWIVCQYSAM